MKRMKLLLTLLLALLLLAACNSSNEADGPADNDATGGEEPATTEVDEELEAAKAKFEPLGEIPVPEDNEMTEEKIALGQMLYFDERLSGNNKLSCASCHAPGAGYGDGLATFIGFEGFEGHRNSPTIINSGYYKENFWDGRAGGLEEQALGPIQAEGEMNQNLDELIEELNAVPGYVDEFNKVFNDKITADNIAKAIATFERTIVVKDTAFDKYLAGDDDAISDEAKEGMKLFVGKASCISCHAGPLLSDHNYHNLGMEGDDGRFAVTGNETDKGKFRTSGLRGIADTAPYMHDGSLATLEDVVNYYNTGGGAHPNKSELMKPLNLTQEEVSYLVAFLESMSGDIPMVEKPELPQ
ncbi:cytochrome-c peroxidase [Robertmurraya siralis]|uniref:Methylamine utilization protein MauG n=1 Tax=Robertmurraya siralis TaxID=77777 RepID=A0A919WIR5_9BACI|nr:cytochrome c peroxidase [Robertmurraya siralis]PAE18342.1 cytochrome-c peroxidase [Bacillus sp. 7504-2]GIN62786.1 cytochrome-c peroxidase [Robertmurraya siralis]